jgi:hypothetical protein
LITPLAVSRAKFSVRAKSTLARDYGASPNSKRSLLV